MRIKDHQRFCNVASGFQSWAVAIAVIIGGLWTAWTFGIVDYSEQSRRQNLGLSIEVDAQQLLPGPDPSFYYILSTVKITNRATSPRSVVFNDRDHKDWAPLIVESIQFNDQGTISLSKEICQPNQSTNSRVIRSEETVSYPFVVRVNKPGFYRVRLWIKLNDAELSVHNDTVRKIKAKNRSDTGPGPTDGPIYWDGQTIVLVTASPMVTGRSATEADSVIDCPTTY